MCLYRLLLFFFLFFFFNDTATTEIYTLSLHDALPICSKKVQRNSSSATSATRAAGTRVMQRWSMGHSRNRRSEEHTSELQSRSDLVCRLLLEKKKKKSKMDTRPKKRMNLRTEKLVAVD